MSALTHRPWAGPQDAGALRALAHARFHLLGPAAYPSASDFDYWLAVSVNPRVPWGIELWFAGSEPVACVWPSPGEVDFFVRSDLPALLPVVFAWALAQAEAYPAASAGAASATATSGGINGFCLEDNAPLAALFAAHGFARSEDFLHCRWYDMADALPPAPTLPPGYSVRSLQGPQEAEARTAAHRAAFPDWAMTAAAHLRAMQSANYRPDLDMVAVAPDGALVAVCLVWYDADLRAGLFEPIGCDPAHQRKGLATACIVEGLQRLRALGARTASVCGWRDDSQGSRLYRKLGFRDAMRQYVWTRALANADSP